MINSKLMVVSTIPFVVTAAIVFIHLLRPSSVSPHLSAVKQQSPYNVRIFSPFEKWLIYHNEAQRISFKYPPELEVHTFESGNGFDAILNPAGKEFYSEGLTDNLIDISINFKISFSQYQAALSKTDSRFQKIESFTLNGHTVYKKTSFDPLQINYVLDYHGNLLSCEETFREHIPPPDQSQYYEMYETMVNTLQLNF
jgi:hypothetical protein